MNIVTRSLNDINIEAITLLNSTLGIADTIRFLNQFTTSDYTVEREKMFEPGLPGFEFFIEADGEEIWSGLDLQTHYPEIMEQYPDKYLVINWRSLPVTLI